METKPAARRWYQISVRTMLVLVVLCAAAIRVSPDVWNAYHRRATRAWLEKSGGSVVTLAQWNREHLWKQPDPIPLSRLRIWLGDEPLMETTILNTATSEDIERVRASFPEAEHKLVAPPPPPGTGGGFGGGGGFF